jgi:hypothetical protein
MHTYRVPAFFYVDADSGPEAERLTSRELHSAPVQKLIGDTLDGPEIPADGTRKYTPPAGNTLEVARAVADQARAAYLDAAAQYALRLGKLAALLVHEQMPTAALLVFDKDEETVTADTTIEIVSIRDADGKALGKLDRPTDHEVCALIRSAYDCGTGFFPVADQDTYDTESVGSEWQDRNLLEMHIDEMSRK